jgi:hypothetical protein
VAGQVKFVSLFTRSHALRMLVLVAGLQCFPEGKNISDLQQLKLMDVGADTPMRSNFVAAFGVCMVLGGKLASYSIKYLGPRWHTTVNNLLTIASFVTFGTANKVRLPRTLHLTI